MEELEWEALCQMLGKIGMITVFGMILSPVPNFLFCGLTQKEKEAKMATFSFSFLLLSLLNNLLWLAYSQKVGDENIGIPAMVGTLVGVLLIGVFLSVKSTRNQIIACFLLVSISEIFFSNLVPTFLNGCSASFLSISTYLSTLGQIPRVIREKDSRYISLPMVTVSIVNALIWAAYAVLKKDIPLFMTNSLAFCFMSVNMTFYLWANDSINTSTIQMLISFFKIAFPEDDENEKALASADEEAACEKRLDEPTDDEHYRTKAEICNKFSRNDGLLSGRATEETRLTSNSGSSSAKASMFYYTGGSGSFGIEEEETKDYGTLSVDRSHANYSLYSPGARSRGGDGDGAAKHDESCITEHFLIEDTSVDYSAYLREDGQRGRATEQLGAKNEYLDE
mmetsp:Transcript_31410/g.38993  ORF Transcript_31410/g.38993 Transcript_31410/m.38993 type:complete len:395 (+) Transcript_31410:118-1302(+)